jgi:hypothetical protein
MTKSKSPDLIQENESSPPETVQSNNGNNSSANMDSLASHASTLSDSESKGASAAAHTSQKPQATSVLFYQGSSASSSYNKHMSWMTSSDELESTSTSASVSTSTSPPGDSSVLLNAPSASRTSRPNVSETQPPPPRQRQQLAQANSCQNCTNKMLENELTRLASSPNQSQSSVIERSLSDIYGRRFASCSYLFENYSLYMLILCMCVFFLFEKSRFLGKIKVQSIKM